MQVECAVAVTDRLTVTARVFVQWQSDFLTRD